MLIHLLTLEQRHWHVNQYSNFCLFRLKFWSWLHFSIFHNPNMQSLWKDLSSLLTNPLELWHFPLSFHRRHHRHHQVHSHHHRYLMDHHFIFGAFYCTFELNAYLLSRVLQKCQAFPLHPKFRFLPFSDLSGNGTCNDYMLPLQLLPWIPVSSLHKWYIS